MLRLSFLPKYNIESYKRQWIKHDGFPPSREWRESGDDGKV